MENSTTISAGGMEIKVVGNQITFTICNKNWQMSVGECEAMLESHQLLIDACHQIINSAEVFHNEAIVSDIQELSNGIKSAKEALKRADVI